MTSNPFVQSWPGCPCDPVTDEVAALLEKTGELVADIARHNRLETVELTVADQQEAPWRTRLIRDDSGWRARPYERLGPDEHPRWVWALSLRVRSPFRIDLFERITSVAPAAQVHTPPMIVRGTHCHSPVLGEPLALDAVVSEL